MYSAYSRRTQLQDRLSVGAYPFSHNFLLTRSGYINETWIYLHKVNVSNTFKWAFNFNSHA